MKHDSESGAGGIRASRRAGGFLRFLKYNNFLPIAFTVMFAGFSATFAASEQARGAIYSSRQTVLSVDNAYILAADLERFDHSLRINDVKDAGASYVIDYSYRTIGVEGDAWNSIGRSGSLNVSKLALGEKDLGVFAAAELSEIVNREKMYLLEAKRAEEAKGRVPTVVAVEYGGLIGKMLKPSEKVFDGYSPVKNEKPDTEEASVAVPAVVQTASVTNAASPNPEEILPEPLSDEKLREKVRSMVDEMIAERMSQMPYPNPAFPGMYASGEMMFPPVANEPPVEPPAPPAQNEQPSGEDSGGGGQESSQGEETIPAEQPDDNATSTVSDPVTVPAEEGEPFSPAEEPAEEAVPAEVVLPENATTTEESSENI